MDETLLIYPFIWIFVKVDDFMGGENSISKTKPCIGDVLAADLSRRISKSIDKYGLLKGAIQGLVLKADWSISKP